MNREEYLDYLEGQSRNCPCPELSGLFKKENETHSLEARCDFFRSNANLLNPHYRDRKFILEYQNSVERFKDAVADYYKLLNELIESKKLKPLLHSETEFSPKSYISASLAREMLEKNDAIITIHCVKCEQQVTLAD